MRERDEDDDDNKEKRERRSPTKRARLKLMKVKQGKFASPKTDNLEIDPTMICRKPFVLYRMTIPSVD